MPPAACKENAGGRVGLEDPETEPVGSHLLECYHDHPHLHSFPTRRSSDLCATSLRAIPPSRTRRGFGDTGIRRPPTALPGARSAGSSSTTHFSNRRAKDRKSTRLNSSHSSSSYAACCVQRKCGRTCWSRRPRDRTRRVASP